MHSYSKKQSQQVTKLSNVTSLPARLSLFTLWYSSNLFNHFVKYMEGSASAVSGLIPKASFARSVETVLFDTGALSKMESNTWQLTNYQ